MSTLLGRGMTPPVSHLERKEKEISLGVILQLPLPPSGVHPGTGLSEPPRLLAGLLYSGPLRHRLEGRYWRLRPGLGLRPVHDPVVVQPGHAPELPGEPLARAGPGHRLLGHRG